MRVVAGDAVELHGVIPIHRQRERRAAARAFLLVNVGFSAKGFKGLQPQIREVLFLDT